MIDELLTYQKFNSNFDKAVRKHFSMKSHVHDITIKEIDKYGRVWLDYTEAKLTPLDSSISIYDRHYSCFIYIETLTNLMETINDQCENETR